MRSRCHAASAWSATSTAHRLDEVAPASLARTGALVMAPRLHSLCLCATGLTVPSLIIAARSGSGTFVNS
jgi:hypothetical protein